MLKLTVIKDIVLHKPFKNLRRHTQAHFQKSSRQKLLIKDAINSASGASGAPFCLSLIIVSMYLKRRGNCQRFSHNNINHSAHQHNCALMGTI